MSEWISVDDGFPFVGQKVLLFSNGVVQEETYSIDYGGEAGARFFWNRDGFDDCPFVKDGDKWMPLPGAPNER